MRFVAFILTALLFSCTQKKVSILNEDALATQSFTITTGADTVLHTAGGALLSIQKESFSGSVGPVTLQVKEAYALSDIIRAGLITRSNGKPLSSGGMIYINTEEKGIALTKPIGVSLPTTDFDPAMNVYKGDKKGDTINWVEPVPLTDTLQPLHNAGRALFASKCATCHAYDKIRTAPALHGLRSRGPWSSRAELIKFTHNAGAYIPTTCYTKNLQREYGGQIMPSFPQLEDEILNALYDYLESMDKRNGIDLTNRYVASPCDDSCRRYDSVRYAVVEKTMALQETRNNLIATNENRVNYNRITNVTTGNGENNNNQISPPAFKEKVIPDDYQAVYYRFDITSLGWYNIDKLWELPESEYVNLKVSIDDSLSSQWELFIAVPQHKIFDYGGKLADGINYGFFTLDGKLPIPVGTEVVVFALGEVDGKVAFDYSKFITDRTNSITLHPKLSTREAFNETVKAMTLPGISIAVNDFRNAAAIRTVDKLVKEEEGKAMQFKPKLCDCNCTDSELTDTLKVEMNNYMLSK